MAPKTNADTPKITKRERRKKRIEKATLVTFSLDPDVRRLINAEARAQGMLITHFMQKLVESHIVDTGADGEPLVERLRAKRLVIERAQDIARKIDAEGGFNENFILTVMQAGAADPEFAKAYDLAVEDGSGSDRARASLNQQLGRIIKKTVNAKSKRNDTGRIARAQVAGEAISTYTLLTKAA